ncbi:MAG: geranylgeranylglycerol-phosphate geranylgeranyltransferase [Bacteroidota bacterium]
MNKILSYCRLIRLNNLLIIAITQYLVRYCLLKPAFALVHLENPFDEFHFALLVIATLLTAAAGNVINDYFDLPIDRVNKASKITLGKTIYFKLPIFLHYLLSGLGILIGLYLGWYVHSISLGLVFLIVTIMLWYYSFKYKRLLLWGNLVVAFLTALVIFIVFLFEFFASRNFPDTFVEIRGVLQRMLPYVLGYTTFAFLVSFIREIIKDIEDMTGDEQFGCNTLPIAWGVGVAKKVLYAIIFVTICLLGYVQFKLYSFQFEILALSLMVSTQIPLIFVAAKIYAAKEKPDWHFLSQVAKLIMLLGVLSMLLVYNSIF